MSDLLILYSVLVLLTLSQIRRGMNIRPGEIQTQVSSHLTLKCSLFGKLLYMQTNAYLRLRQTDTKKEILI